MIELVSANDQYSLDQHLLKLSDTLGLDPIYFDASLKDFSFEQLYFEVISVDMFNPTKLIIVKNALFLSSKGKLVDNQESLFSQILEASDEIHLVFTLFDLKFDSKKKAVKVAKEKGKLTVLEDVKEQTIKQCITQANKKYGFNLKQNEIERFVEYCPSLQSAMNAIEKLKLYDGPITLSVIELLVEDSSDIVLFDLSNAIIEKDMNLSFELYQTLKNKNTDLSGLIYILASKFRQMYISSQLKSMGYNQQDVASMMKISPNYAWVLMNKLNHLFHGDSLLRILSELSEFDRKSKKFMVDKNIEFELWLVNYGRKYGKFKGII